VPFQPGQSGNPKGRVKGQRNKATQMVDALLFQNVKDIAEVLVREAKTGRHWAVKAALNGMLPSRSRRIEEPLDLPPMTTVQEAVQRISIVADLVAQGGINVDDGERLIEGARAYVEARKTAELEQEVEQLRETVATLLARVENGNGGTRR
jgi:hypothetical protein